MVRSRRSYSDEFKLQAVKLVTEHGYSYALDGSLRSVVDSATSERTDYTYDGFGNLTRVALPDGRVIEYLIDGQNRRVGKKVDGVLTQGLLYDGQLTPVAQLDASGSVVARFVYATGVNVPEYMIKDGVTYRLIADHLGSVRLVVNSTTGEVVQRLDYDAFGRALVDTSPGFQPFAYAGGLYESYTGLVRFGARDFDAYGGRWVAKDGIAFRGRDTNLYRYSSGQPVELTDPSGLIDLDTFDLLRRRDQIVRDAMRDHHGDLALALRDIMNQRQQNPAKLYDPAHVHADHYIYAASKVASGESVDSVIDQLGLYDTWPRFGFSACATFLDNAAKRVGHSFGGNEPLSNFPSYPSSGSLDSGLHGIHDYLRGTGPLSGD